MRTIIIGVAVSVLAASMALAALQTPAQRRDSPAAPQKGTTVIRGKVIAADTGKPLRRARVSLSAIGLGSESRRSTSTGLDGSYSFKELPAGRYRITVSRSGYLQLEYGQRRPGEQGRPIEASDAQTIEKIDFALPRMSGIIGRVTDEHGEAIEGVAVYAMRLLFYEGRRKLVPVSGTNTRTDDEGEYRITRLAPGSYQVMASTKETWTVVSNNGQESVLGYMPTYFPGVSGPADARRVTVGVGELVRGIDFALVPGRAARVSGIALDSQGRPFTRVTLSEEIRGTSFASFGAGPAVRVSPDGTFVAQDVPPGEYTLAASRTGGTPEGGPEVALMTLFVDGTDIENIILTGSGGATVNGRVLSDDGTPLPKTTGIFVSITEVYRNQQPPVLLGTFRTSHAPTVKEDGTFSVPHVFGRARFQVTVPDGWMVKRIVHDGQDITEKVLELRSGEQLHGVDIVLTNRLTQLSGGIVDDKGAPSGEATVLVFPADADRWFENSRSIRASRPDQQGRWQVKGLPAGEYLAIALEYVEEISWQDPEYLESLRRDAEKVTIAEGGAHTLALRVTSKQ